MAITYNGTPITAVQYNGTTYRTIAHEDGYLLYSCQPVRFYSFAPACYNFAGFDFSSCRSRYCARAVINYNGCHSGVSCISWVNGKISDCSNMDYSTCMYFQLGCIYQRVVGSGYCGVNYTFDVKRDPSLVCLGQCVCMPPVGCMWITVPLSIDARESTASLGGTTKWTDKGCNCRLYSNWVEIDYCDYVSGLNCQSFTNICPPVIYPYCGETRAKLKNGQDSGCTTFDCCYIVNPLGSRTPSVVSCIRVC